MKQEKQTIGRQNTKQLAVLVFEMPPGSQYDIGHQDSEDLAKAAFKELEKLAKKGEVAIESATVVAKDENGTVKIRKTSEWTAGSGAGRGAFWGLLVGLVLAGPFAGLLAGIGLGAILGGRAHQPIDKDFMKDVGNRLKPGDSALFMLIEGDDEATINHLEAYAAPMYTTVLTDDVEEALEKASEHEDVLEAIKFDELD